MLLGNKRWLLGIFSLCLFLVTTQAFAVPKEKYLDNATVGNNTENIFPGIQEEVQNFVQDIISITGGMMSGMAAGMQEGADKAQAQLDGADGVQLVSNKEELAKFLQVNVFKPENQGTGAWRVSVAVKNSNDFPVRLTNLTHKQTVLLLDVDGFAYEQTLQENQPRTVTVPAKAAVKISFVFDGLDEQPGVFRLLDTDFLAGK